MVLNVVGIDASNNTVSLEENTTVALVGGSTVSNTHEAAVRDGRVFTTSAISQINAGQFLNIVFKNPTDSGKNALFIARKMQSNRKADEAPAPYAFMLSPLVTGDTTTLTAGNRNTGSGNTSAMEVCTTQTSQRIQSQTPTAYKPSGFIPVGGAPINIDAEAEQISRIVTPGSSFALTFGSTGRGTSNDTVRVVMTWVEEDI